MSDIGFTGTREGMTEEQKAAVRGLLEGVKKKEMSPVFHHGDCVGADFEAASIARELGCVVVGHPPTNEKHRVFFESDLTLPAKGYLERDRDIVEECDFLIAAPYSHIEEFKYSGTWYTVRYARDKVPVCLVLPTGRVVEQ